MRAIRLAALAAAVSFAGPLAPASHADPINQIATWTGGAGDGKWSSLANWSPQTVPANDANDLYNVIVGNNVNLTFDLPTAATINGISFGPGGSLAVGSGDQLTITNVASLNSSVSSNGAGSIFTATGVGVSLGPNAHLAATAGGVINVAPSTFVYTTGGIQVPVCTADGAGSVVNESTMTSMSANNSLTSSDIQPVYTATNGGAINLSGLLSIDGGIGPHFMNIFRDVAVSETYFVIGANSDINLANLKQITGFAQFTVQRSSYSLPSLQTASATTFNLSAGTAMNLPALVTLAGGTSALNVPNTASFNAPVATTLNDTQFNVSAGGTVNAHNVTTLDNSTLAIAVGGTVDIHSLQEATNTFIAMAPGANLDYTAPIRFDNSRLSITGGASFNVAATSYTYTRNASETAWSADGAGSVISAPSMTSMVSTQSFIGDVRPVYSATNGGVINLSGLQTFNGGAGPLSQVAIGSSFSFSTFFIDSSSNIKLDSLKTLSGWNSFTIQRSSYSFPSLQTMSATTFTLNVGTTVNAPALTTVAGGSSSIPIPSFASFNASSLKTLNDTTLSLSVGGAFTAPQLSTIQNTNITFPSGADFTYGTIKNFDDSTVSISGGAVFNLAVPSYTFDRDSTVTAWHTDGPGTRINSPSTSSIVDTVGFPAYRAINSSMIDLSGLRFALGANTFQANSGGSILFGSLKSYSNFTADGSASSLNFKSLNLTAGGTLVATNLANIVLQGSLAYTTTSPSSINLDQGVLDFAADSRPQLEVGGSDQGTGGSGLSNFGIQQLVIGSASQRAVVELTDAIDNGHRGGSGKEALYLLDVSGHGARILNGSTLVLNHLDAYSISGNAFINLNSLFPAGQNRVAYDGGFLSKSMADIGTAWKVDADGNWSDASNWNVASPNGVGDVAYFGPVISVSRTVTVDSPRTVGYLGFEGNQQYTIAGNSITMDSQVSNTIEVVSGVHQVTAPMFLNKDTLINITGANDSLRLEHVAASGGVTISKMGAGALNIAPVGQQANLAIAAGSVNMISSAAVGATSFNNVDVASGTKWNLISYDQTVNTIANNGTIDLGFGRLTVAPGDAGSSFAGTITGSAGVLNAGLSIAGVVNPNVSGSGILTLSGNTTYQGDTNILSGGLKYVAGNIAATASAFTVATGASLDLTNNSQTIGSLAGAGSVALGSATLSLGGNNLSTAFSGTISGAGGITKTGSGTFVLGNANPFSGTTTINAGVVQLTHALALQNSTVQLNVNNGLDLNGLAATVGTISGGGNLAISGPSLTVGGNGNTTVYSGSLSGGGQLIKTGAGSLILRGGNSYTGGTLINGGGTLNINDDSNLGQGGAGVTMNNALLYWNTSSAWTTSRPIAVTGGTGALQTDNATVTLNGVISGPGTFVKTGDGTIVLNATNTVTGGMNLQAGQLELDNNSALGTGTLAATNITPGANIVISKTSGAPVTTINNPIRLDLGATSIDFRVDNGFTLDLEGPISGTSDFQKGTGGASGANVGTGILALGGNNSAYNGTITVQTGTLSVRSNTALGAPGGGTRVSPGATLSFDGALNYAAAEPIALAGTLAATGGATTFGGSITLAGPSTVNIAAGSSFTTGNITGAFTLTKTGSGTLTLSGPNAYTGDTVINGGSVNVLAGASVATQHVTVTAGASFTTAGSLSNVQTLVITDASTNVQSTGSMTVGGPSSPVAISFLGNNNPSIQLFAGATSGGHLTILSDMAFTGSAGTAGIFAAGSGAVPGALDLGTGVRTISVADGSAPIDLEISAPVINGGINKSGPGTLRLSGADGYAGGTTITGGTIEASTPSALGAGVVTFGSGGAGLRLVSDAPTLTLANALTTAAANSISVDIEPINNPAAATFNVGAASLGTAFNVTGAAGGTLVVSGVTLQNNGGSPTAIHNSADLTINGTISQTGSNGDILKDSAGTLTLSGSAANTFAGTMTVGGGTLQLNKPVNVAAIPNDLLIIGGGVTRLMASGQIAPASHVTINAASGASLLDLNGHDNTLAALNFVAGGTLASGTGTATLGGDVQFTGATGTANVTGNLNLGPAVRTFNIARGSAAADMMIAATISGGPGSGTALTKTGAGILVLSGANTYTGNTLVNQGTLSVAAGGSLASASVAVASGATLKVDGTLSPTTAVSATGNVVFPGNTTGAAVTRTAGALTIGAGVTVQLGASSYSKTPAILSLASLAFGDGTAKLDVSNDELITGGSTAANLRTVIVGSQLFSSAAGPGFGIGSIDVSGGKAEARFTLLGDANLDGAVDVGDLGVLATSYGITSSNIGWSQGDSNYSGGVDVGDLGSLATNYGSSLTTAPAVVSDASEAMVAPIAQALAEVSSPTAVPEPGCLGILATIGGVAASRKRRR